MRWAAHATWHSTARAGTPDHAVSHCPTTAQTHDIKQRASILSAERLARAVDVCLSTRFGDECYAVLSASEAGLSCQAVSSRPMAYRLAPWVASSTSQS